MAFAGTLDHQDLVNHIRPLYENFTSSNNNEVAIEILHKFILKNCRTQNCPRPCEFIDAYTLHTYAMDGLCMKPINYCIKYIFDTLTGNVYVSECKGNIFAFKSMPLEIILQMHRDVGSHDYVDTVILSVDDLDSSDSDDYDSSDSDDDL